MSHSRYEKCGACGRTASTHAHRCPVAIPRDAWVDVVGAVRFVSFPCPDCAVTISTDEVNPAQQPATAYGVANYECAACSAVGEVRFRDWPMRPMGYQRQHRSRFGESYGT